MYLIKKADLKFAYCVIMLRSFYRYIDRTTREQFQLDFGHFPPVPLREAHPIGAFRILHSRGLGTLLRYLRMSRYYLEILEYEPARLSAPTIRTLLPMITFECNTNINTTDQQPACRFKFPRFMMRFFFIVRIVAAEYRGSGTLAHVLPVMKDECHITILGKIPISSSKFEILVTHEHIHVLQLNHDIHREIVAHEPELVLSEKFANKPETLYLLDRYELEARLHEVVLHYYRSEGKLPISLSEFINLVNLVDFHSYMSQGATENNEYLHIPCAPTSFHVDQFYNLLYRIKDSLRDRFIREVLSVMYGNLLRYYGDREMSDNWQSSINRPNLYDVLYPPFSEERLASDDALYCTST